MANLTEKEIKDMNSMWSKIDYNEFGGEALKRLLIVKSLSKGNFKNLGNISSNDAIANNPKVKTHGEKILRAVGDAMKYLDNLDMYFGEQRQYYAEVLTLDPQNFKHFSDALVIVLALHFSKEFTPEVQAPFEKTFRAMKDAFFKATTK